MYLMTLRKMAAFLCKNVLKFNCSTFRTYPISYLGCLTAARNYRNNFHRQPLKVILPDGTVLPRKGSGNVSSVTFPQSQQIDTENHNLAETVTQNENSSLSLAMQRYTSKKNKEKWIFLEGKRLISDALEAGAKLDTLLVTKMDMVQEFNIPSEVKVSQVTRKEMKSWSTLTTPPGIIGIFKMPSMQSLKYEPSLLPLTVICDNIREPGNLGSILRCAAGAGCERVLLSKGCVDVWEPKVLRGGSGAHFRIPIIKSLMWDNMPALIDMDSKVIVADNHYKEAQNDLSVSLYHTFDSSALKSIVVIVGGETEGLSSGALEFAKKYAGERVTIPLQKGVESLNVVTALGIIMFEIRRQFMCK